MNKNKNEQKQKYDTITLCKFQGGIGDVWSSGSRPIITCSGKRHCKVAKEIIDKTFCATKGIWYFGLKLHVLGMYRPGKLPFPESIIITQASENDLKAFKQNWADLSNRQFYGDKIYNDTEFFVNMTKPYNSAMLTPVKGVKGQPDCLKFFDRPAEIQQGTILIFQIDTGCLLSFFLWFFSEFMSRGISKLYY